MKGMFYRRFTLPDSADAEQIEAKAKRGVLEINIGKKKIAQSRKIKIESDE
jgi:HSP20 family protein